MHNDSVSSAFERRIAFSSMRERITSASVGLSYVNNLVLSRVHDPRLLTIHTDQSRMLEKPLVRTL